MNTVEQQIDVSISVSVSFSLKSINNIKENKLKIQLSKVSERHSRLCFIEYNDKLLIY